MLSNLKIYIRAWNLTLERSGVLTIIDKSLLVMQIRDYGFSSCHQVGHNSVDDKQLTQRHGKSPYRFRCLTTQAHARAQKIEEAIVQIASDMKGATHHAYAVP